MRDGLQVIVFASQKGGVGKTTLTANLGVAAEIAGDGPAVLIDTDPQGSLAAWWNAREAETPALAPTRLNDLPEKLKALGEAGFRYALVDTPPAITDAIRAVVKCADFVVIPVRPAHMIFGRWTHCRDRAAGGEALRLCRHPSQEQCIVDHSGHGRAIRTRRGVAGRGA